MGDTHIREAVPFGGVCTFDTLEHVGYYAAILLRLKSNSHERIDHNSNVGETDRYGTQ